MPIKTMTPSKQQVEELRNVFNEKYEKSPPAVPFHPVDLDRIRNDDVWCRHFLEMYDLDVNTSFEKLWSTCIWRQQYGANDLDETKLRMDYLTDGVIFPRNKDIDGKPLLIFKTKLHVKGSKDMDEVLKVLVYWIERLHRDTNIDKCTLFFDMEGTGLSNMDLDFIKMVIETFKTYYPNALNYILVYEMAWVLSAAFKIVKALLPEKAVEILKVIKNKDINQYIDKDNCLTSWGGNDDYQYSFVPEKRISVQQTDKLPNGTTPSSSDDLSNDGNDKKVHFAKSSIQQTSTAEQNIQMHDIPEHFTPQDHEMLQVSPQDFLKFPRSDTKESTLELSNTSIYPVTYKIQTTSPEKFRVRPRLGILNPGENVSVNIFLKPEHNLSENSKDKFLIMCLPAVDIQLNENADFWKKVDSNASNIEQHRLCCVYKDVGGSGAASAATISNGYSASSGDKNIASKTGIFDETHRLEKQLRNTQILQLATLVFVLILSAAVIYLLKLQLCSDDGCFNREESASNIDFGSCAKSKADL